MIGKIKTKRGDVIVRDIRIDNDVNMIKICFEQSTKVAVVEISTHKAKEIGFMNIDKLDSIVNNWSLFK